MAEYKLGEIEMRFADIIWDHEPMPSGELVKLCAQTLDWKKSTTYTILRRVCERGLFQNKDGVVTSLVSKEEFFAMQSEKFVEDTFSGSLPKFLAAFTRRKKLSEKEIVQLQRIIAENQKNSAEGLVDNGEGDVEG
ncbi:MAG: BlaI/MecI/CopY family transcriptional regulator [Lachnospiraceae bacterium]|jgi:predicted transcriptional regulator|nr:BlaI/MecI/CopY family transcriptional regulator [Lachnospiraceae bacterium]